MNGHQKPQNGQGQTASDGPAPHKRAYTILEAAKEISVSKSTMKRLIQRREIFPTKNLRLIPGTELDRYLAEQVTQSRNLKRGFQKKVKPQPSQTLCEILAPQPVSNP